MTRTNDGQKRRFLALFLAFFLIIGASCATCNAATSVSSGALKPTTRDKEIANYFSRLLEVRHISKQKIDQGVSERGFGLFLKAIDPTKIYFTQADVDEFTAAYSKTMASELKRGNVEPAFVVYNRFLQRMNERCAYALQALEENKFDFTVDEEFIRDKEQTSYPKTEAEARDRMNKRIKFEILSLEAEDRDKQKNAENEGTSEEKTAEAANQTVPGRADDPISKLKRRYSTLQKRMAQTTNDDLLEIYLTAVANAYDPHTTYMSPKSYENFKIQIGLELEGIGATLQWDDGYTIIKRIVKGSPAEKSGELKVEDKIVGVGQGAEGQIEDVVDMKLTDVVDKIRGKGGTIVRLEIVSQDGKKKIVSIVREKIDLEDSAAQSAIFNLYQQKDGSVVICAEDDSEENQKASAESVATLKIGVIDLPSFYFNMDAKSTGATGGRSCSYDVERILRDFNAKKVDACVVDLRYNGGGSLPEAVSLTGLFIKKGAVVQTKPSELGVDRPRPLLDPDPDIVWSKPLVVLTSRLSASASEIFSGAIRDYRRGLLVGDATTHGKGSVQSMSEISNALFGALLKNAPNLGAMKVTIQGYYLPSGVSPQLQGVPSDVQVPQFTSALEDVAESDLDYPLSFAKVAPAEYPVFKLVEPQVVEAVAKKSKARVEASKEFQEEMEKIELYKNSPLRKRTPLNREKYFAELDKLNANKEETEKMEEIVNGDSGVKRDYYLDEILNITKDYCEAIQFQQAI